jgi:hypothetical protein
MVTVHTALPLFSLKFIKYVRSCLSYAAAYALRMRWNSHSSNKVSVLRYKAGSLGVPDVNYGGAVPVLEPSKYMASRLNF